MKPIKTAPRQRASRYNIEALARGLDILELFSPQSPALNMTDVLSRLHLSKSTIFRLLSTLETLGYLERDPATRRYRPSIKVLHLGFAVINSLEVRQVARPYLERLAQELEETVSLCVLDGDHVTYVDRVRNQSIVGVSLKVGSRIPAHCASIGKVLLANLTSDELDRFLRDTTFVRCTPRTTSEPEVLHSELMAVKKNGYAICDGELAVGLRAAGAPLLNHLRKAVAAINVSGAATTISVNRLKKIIVPAVVRTAAQISYALGFPPAEIPEGWKTFLNNGLV
jgi:IclR family transcriptional regulator, pca regulon regulatory protein